MIPRECEAPVMDTTGEPNHDLSPTCWCQPVMDYENPLTLDRVYVHKRFLDLGIRLDGSDRLA